MTSYILLCQSLSIGDNFNFWTEVCIAVLGTIIGGAILTFLLFIINEFILPKEDLTGEWWATTVIEHASLSKYEKLSINWKFHLLKQGYTLIGHGEKIDEVEANGDKHVYLRKKRVRSTLNGYIQRTYFTKTKIFISALEEGRERPKCNIRYETHK